MAFDWAWIPGVAAAIPATCHTLWLRRRFDREVVAAARDLHRQAASQAQHALMLWPRSFEGGRPLTQAEQIITGNRLPDMDPISPEQQHETMRAEAQRLLDSYKPRTRKEPDEQHGQ